MAEEEFVQEIPGCARVGGTSPGLVKTDQEKMAKGEAESTSTWPDEMQNHLHGVEAKLQSARVTQQK